MQGQRGQDFETAARGRHSFRFLGPRPNDRLSHPVKEAAYRAAIHLNPQRGVERLAHFLQAALGIALMRAPQERLRLGGEFATISLTPPVQETGEALGRQAGLVTKILWPTKGHRVSAEKLVHGQIGSSDLFYHRCDLLGSAFPAGRGPVHPPQHSLNMAIWPACSAVFVRSWGIKRYNWTMLFRGEDSSSSWLLIISSTDSFLRARESRSYVELRSGPVSANCNSPKYQTIVMYVELQRHCHVVEERRNQAAVRIGETLGLPLLATNGVRYATAPEREILDVFTCIRNHCKLETAGRLLERNDERHLRSTEEMVQLFSDLPQAIHNTLELSARLEYTLADLGYEFPRYPVPEGETMDSFLRKRTEEGFLSRYAVKRDDDLFERAKRQVQRELALIEKLHLAGYFLIVWDIIRFCREQKILVQVGFDMNHPRVRKYWELCERIQDLPRHLGQHSGGMVVCQGQLDSVVPLEPATMPGRVVVQWDKDDCADMGIIKIDLLGLGMMAVLEECLELIPKHYGKPVDLAQLPPDDPPVYETLRKADTVGMFQVESRAQMASLPRNAPVKFYDLVVQVAIIRPGPIVGKMMHPYMNRRQGKEPVTYAHPSLEPILERTLGVPLFQEQLLRIAMVAANFTGGEAEDLRRAMGFKRSEERMHKIEAKLRSGMTKNGFSPGTQEEIITQITSFARYGFPESHAASFALIAYASAYLKVHYLAAFTAALLNNQPMGFYSPAVLVHDAQLHGLRVKPINALHSEWNCTIEHTIKEDRDIPCLRIGFRYVRGLRQTAADKIVSERQERPFEGIDDLVRRVPELQKAELVTLSEIGALNSLGSGVHRRTALWQVERAARPAGPLLDAIPEQMELSPLRQMTDEERLVADFHGSGMSTGPHPMTYCREALSKLQVKRACDLPRVPDGQCTRVAGCVIARQRPGTAKGFVFLSLEDETGISNVIVNPDLYEKYRVVINREKFLRVEGVLQNQDHTISIKAARVLPISITAAETQSHDFH